MNETFASAVLNSLWQGTLLTMAVWVVLRRQTQWSAATRLAIWQLTLAVVLLLPALRQLPLHGWFETVLPAARPASPQAVASPAGSAEAFEVAVPLPPRPVVELPSEEPAEMLLALAVLLGTFQLLRLAVAYFTLRRWKGRSRQATLTPPFALARPVTVRLSSRITMPMAVGYRRPAILLPEALVEQLTPDQMHHVLLHEAAHLERGDDWATLGERLVRAVFAFHPAVYWIGRHLDREREMACDDWVVAHAGATKPYAEALARVAELSLVDRAPILAAGAGRRREIFVRLEALLDSARNRMPAASHPLVLGAGLVLLFVVAQSTPYSHLLGFSSYDTRHVVIDDRARREFKMRGDIEFSVDDRDVVFMAPGAKLVVAAGDRWLPREVELEAGPDGQIKRLYFSGGVRQPFDTEAQRFLSRELSTWLRNEPIHLSERLGRWIAAGGSEEALREIRSVSNTHTKRLYLEELLVKVAPNEEFLRRTLRVAAEIDSDAEKRAFLANTASRFRGYAQPVLTFVDSLHSEHDRREMLTELAAELPLPAFPRLAASIARMNSDHERAEVLLAVLGSSPEEQAPLLAVVAALHSDHDKARVLEHAAERYADAAPVREAFFAGVNAITSGQERREVLQALLRRPDLGPETRDSIAAAAQRIHSEHDRQLILNELSAPPSTPDASRETR
jgi:beta-lactamase regulating signal transducer with metallopeptidase domain